MPQRGVDMKDLRARREAQTRREIYATAMQLFAAKGYESTTVSDIATAAGVSRRTIYRYFGTKVEIPFVLPEQWLEHFRGLVEERPDGMSCYDFCNAAVLDVARFIELDAAEVALAFQVLADLPVLLVRHALKNRQWMEAYRQLIATDLAKAEGSAEPTSQHQRDAALLAGAIMGGTDQITFTWLATPGSSLVEQTRAVLRNVEPLWPDAAKVSIE